MNHRGLFFLIIFVLLPGSLAANAQSKPVDEVIWRVNAVRAAYGVPEYQVDYALMAAAQGQASWSAANNHIGHDGPGGSSPADRAIAAGYGAGYKSYATENAAHGDISLNTAEWVVTMWQGDSVHLNALISSKYEHIGVGYAEAGGHSWYVLMAGYVDENSPLDSSSPASGTPAAVVPSGPFILSTPDKTGAIRHEVQPGQTAWTIAAYYKISLAELLALNNLTENSILHSGDILLVRLPEAETGTSVAPAADLASATSARKACGEYDRTNAE